MEIVLVVLAVVVLAAAIGYTQHTRKGQAIVGPHDTTDATAPGTAGPSEVDRDRGEYSVHDRGTQ